MRTSVIAGSSARALSDDEPMRTHVALLRGINVLGRNKVSMADLRQVVTWLGHGDVATYIQSGNVMFTAAKPDANSLALADDLEIAIAERLAVRPAVVVLARRELTHVVRDNPFRDEDDHRLLHAVFLREAPGPNGVASVKAAVVRARSNESRDDARVIGRTLYLWTPDGFARSILRSELSRGGQHRTPMQAGTARNWGPSTPSCHFWSAELERSPPRTGCPSLHIRNARQLLDH